MLRSLFVIVTLANCNYGNIIQHLIKIASQKKRIVCGGDSNSDSNSDSKRLVVVNKGDSKINSGGDEFYLDSNGE